MTLQGFIRKYTSGVKNNAPAGGSFPLPRGRVFCLNPRVPQRIVLFGGTFDPVHNGHLAIARAVAEQRSFEHITFVPSAKPPHKQQAHAAAEHRLAMLRLAVAGDGLFRICELELARGGPSYTIDTLAVLAGEAGEDAELYWIIGADMLSDLPSWRRAGEVLELADIVVAVRSPWHERLEEIFASLEGSFTAAQVVRLRRGVVQTPLIDISSTEVRRLVREGKTVGHLVGEAVSRYIAEHGLYAGDEQQGAGA